MIRTILILIASIVGLYLIYRKIPPEYQLISVLVIATVAVLTVILAVVIIVRNTRNYIFFNIN